MGYLICNNCNGYYELQEDEYPGDFDLECECGGNLIFVDVDNRNTENFSNFKDDYEELMDYLKNNKINFNFKKSEVPISLDSGEKVLINFENIKLRNSTVPNHGSEINRGYLTLTNKKIVFSGNDKLEYALGDIKSIKTSYNGFGLVLTSEFELKDYFIGIDKLKIMLPLKALHDKYSVPFNGEMAKTMIESAIKNHKDTLESESIKNKNIENKKAKKQKKSAKKKDTQSEKLMNCPDCGHKISRKANKCPSCGRPITFKDLPEEDTKMTLGGFIVISSILFGVCFFGGLLLSLILGGLVFLLLMGFWLIFSVGMFISYLKDRKK